MQKEQIEVEQNEQKDNNGGDEDNEDEEEDEEISKEQAVYSFGVRYYYWDYYKNHKKLQRWYIPTKYGSFKEELKDKIKKKQWDQTMTKAKRLLDTEELRNLKSYEWKNYGINMNEELKCENVVAIALYTDYTQLSYQFSKSFRKISNAESDEESKERHREYREWARILRYFFCFVLFFLF